MGINTFFSGTNAQDIALNDVLLKNPALLAAAQNGEVGDNQTALLIGQLATAAQKGLGGANLDEYLQGMMNTLGVQAANARTGTRPPRTCSRPSRPNAKRSAA